MFNCFFQAQDLILNNNPFSLKKIRLKTLFELLEKICQYSEKYSWLQIGKTKTFS
ncbi:hypothetical protein AXA84_0245 [Candidatus Phytoplasma oryzae]|uniref:Uncharacterized protein n=1 Tax=Candidatus Phytoplasma oryzae TaxID=203274 RepID=A0A139JQS0_9MOLU|nr:hypothetical protein [Candidatus Phytoplasma oryzae]KXT29063.1 hypothetical protein AXA84_0426 [Candidatus Phytoplasma oryzae]KXT29086.1 hypothetical protein AXA84_0404 [Candidatus Phytoplasma oryzae]KXT29216.1 hypothetical protein AXA84_0245 [Candidatus Phytoplasma oryzae]